MKNVSVVDSFVSHILVGNTLLNSNSYSNENIAQALLEAYPAALITGNDVGGTPLHLASCGESASPMIVQMLLEKHEDCDYPISSLDVSSEYLFASMTHS